MREKSSLDEWKELCNALESSGIELPLLKKNIRWLEIIKDIGEKEEKGEISAEIARKASLALWETMKDE